MKPTILITGANGQLGSELKYLLKDKDAFSPIFTDYQELDITNKDAILDFFEKYNFNYCINCAAYTAVDKAEEHEEMAYNVNTLASKYLAEACKIKNTFLFHISSDYVYHNGSSGPISELDEKAPKSIYAKSKYLGEEEVRNTHDDHIIFRSSWIYSSYGHNFIKTMLRLGAERDTLNVVNDQIGVPTYARDLADVILSIIMGIEQDDYNIKNISGTYNYCNEGISNWFQFASLIMSYKKLDCTIHPIPTSSYPTPAKRPFNSQLNLDKFKSTFNISIPNWEESVKKVLDLL